MPGPRLFLIDTYGFIFRAYHARARSAAAPMRTSRGMSTEAIYIFHNILKRLLDAYQPEYLAAMLESSGPTLREQSFAEYKANRAEMPDDLRQQIPYIKRLLEALRIPALRTEGYEADDVIGTVAKGAVEQGVDVVIVSSDKDLLQLVNDRVRMLNPMKDDVMYDPAKVQEFMGVPPERVADLLALKGDAIDNIPGAPGIGDKGAKDLILQFGSVEDLLARADEVPKRTYRESLLQHRDQVLMSKDLATIHTNVPLEWHLDGLKRETPDSGALRDFYKELEFYSFLKTVAVAEADPRAKDYATLQTPEEVQAFLDARPPEASLAVIAQTTGKGVLRMTAVGLSYAVSQGRAVPLDYLSSLRPVLEDAGVLKITHDLKSMLGFLDEHGIQGQRFEEDVQLCGYLLTSDPGAVTLESMAERLLDRKLTEGVEQSAETILELHQRLLPDVQARNMEKVYRGIDLPMVPVLRDMEKLGIRVAPDELKRLSASMDEELSRLSQDVYQLAGKTFNINSPQQLGKVLYEDLSVPAPVKFGKGKTLSTAADILENLAEKYPIAQLVLDYRQVAKLKGTYVDTLPLLMDGNGRVHTTFNLTGASTGRLSSTNPNLQNIPIRTELGREIRAAFIPRDGWCLISADYSQIELRLLAHLSGDDALIGFFESGEDVHRRTAAEVFHVSPDEVTSDMRRVAKAVNFGTIYGQTSFGLSKLLSISRQQADRYIQSYFELYAGVRRYIDETIEKARQTGMVETLFGRQRHVPDMNSKNPNARTFAERTAVNSPIQGSAADLIKLAMIRVHARLGAGFQARMLLQVHDELLLEAPPDEQKAVCDLVCHEMENAFQLRVPLLVEVGAGPNWRDAK